MSTTEEPRIATDTQQALYEMLTENTGRALMDSGDYYGRNWQRNQRFSFQDFYDREPSTLSGRWGLEITHDLFHWLDDRVDYESKADHLFEQWGLSGERENVGWLPLAEEFAEMIGGRGLYGDGPPVVVNTYNGEDLLSQTIQYVYFELDEPAVLEQGLDGNVELLDEAHIDDDDVVVLDADSYVLLQIHGGCDVRGGYTRPRIFRVMEELAIMDNARAVVLCTGYGECGIRWFTDDGYNLYNEDGDADDLKDYDTIEAGESKGWARGALLRVLHDMGEDPKDWGVTAIGIDEDGTVYCPISGHPMTAAAF